MENQHVTNLSADNYEKLQTALRLFFAAVDECFPDKRIIWEKWDHERLDKLANYLYKVLGYRRGGDFLVAYGYTLITDDGLYVPQGEIPKPVILPDNAAPAAAKATAEQKEEVPPLQQSRSDEESGGQNVHQGRLVTLLENKNSGFVRDDADGRDYYFNVRSFRSWVCELKPGLPVSFSVVERMDRRYGKMSLTAVDLNILPEQA